MNIEALAKKAGFAVANGSYGLKFSGGDFEKFARLVAAEEREACATTVDEWARTWDCPKAVAAADAIRMRSNVEVSGDEQGA